jgi:replicative DNA helicase
MFFSGMSSKELASMNSAEIRAVIKQGYENWKLGKLLVKTFPMRSATMRDIEGFLKSLKSKEGWFPDLICIDYLELLKPAFRKQENWQEQKEISEEMKAFAQRHKVPVWTAGQLNRGGAKKKIATNEDSSGSYDANFALDVVFTAVPQMDTETDERSAVFLCAKNRQGADQMTLDFDLNLDAMRFIYKPREYKSTAVNSIYNRFKSGRSGK